MQKALYLYCDFRLFMTHLEGEDLKCGMTGLISTVVWDSALRRLKPQQLYFESFNALPLISHIVKLRNHTLTSNFKIIFPMHYYFKFITVIYLNVI